VITDLLLADGQINEFQVVVDRRDTSDPLSEDCLYLRLDAHPDADFERVTEAVRLAAGVRPVIQRVGHAEIFDTEKTLKAKRFVDMRKNS